jgi:hypothetical protein
MPFQYLHDRQNLDHGDTEKVEDQSGFDRLILVNPPFN